MINPYSVEQARENSSHYYLNTILDEISERINAGIDDASKKGYYSATIIHHEHRLRDPKQLNTIIDVIEQKYYKAGYEDVDARWDTIKVDTDFVEYVITVSW